MVNSPDRGDPVPALEVTRGAPGKRADPVSPADTVCDQAIGNPARAPVDLGIVGHLDWPLDRSRDDAALAVLAGSVFNHRMAKKWPILHQAAHGGSPPLLFAIPCAPVHPARADGVFAPY